MEYITSVQEPASPVYNIKHCAFYFSKLIIVFIKNQKYDLQIKQRTGFV
jgi:hypothetical protein